MTEDRFPSEQARSLPAMSKNGFPSEKQLEAWANQLRAINDTARTGTDDAVAAFLSDPRLREALREYEQNHAEGPEGCKCYMDEGWQLPPKDIQPACAFFVASKDGLCADCDHRPECHADIRSKLTAR